MQARGNSEETFCSSCIAGDLNRVRQMLREEPTLVGSFGQVREDHRPFMSQFGAEAGWSPLHLAGHYGHADVVRALREAGADTEVISRNVIGNRPLGSAVAGGSAAVVRELIAGGANLNATDAGGLTPLHLAADGKQHEIISLHVKAGADLSVTDKKGRTPADVAREAEDDVAARMLQDAR